MALSEYMPYGAPELLEGGSTRMARATLFAGVLVSLVFVAVGAGIPRPGAIVVIDEPGPPPLEFARFQVTPPPSGPVAPPAWRTLTDAILVPRPDALVAPAPAVEPALVPVDPTDGSRIGAGESSRGVPGALDTAHVPRLDEYVFREREPELLRRAPAYYPDLAREAGIEGTVRLWVLIGLDGRVENVVVRPGGSVPLLDEVAVEAARRSLYRPALSNDHPVRVWVSQDYRFTLH